MRYLIIITFILALCMVPEATSTVITQLTSNPGTDWMPSWSPDGSTIVYVSSPDIIGHPANGTQDIWTIPAAGGTPTQLTIYGGVDGYGPEYSPDGSRILYSTTMSSRSLGIWSIPIVDGIPADPSYVYDSFANDYNASWSPNGSQIVFETHMGGSGEQLWIVSADGSNSGLTQLTYGPDGDYHPTWSPDGSTILFHSTSRSGGYADLYTVPVTGGTVTRLTDTPEWREHFGAYSPNGQWIAFSSNRSGNWGVWVMPVTGGEQILIVDNVGPESIPSWSPDGTKIAFTIGGTEGGNPVGEDIWIASDLPVEPIPEPSTIVLLSTGLAGIIAYGKVKISRKRSRG